MKKTIWIMNHYAGNMFFEQGGRHYWFACELKKRGYDPVIFCCNAKHGKTENFFDTNELWHEHMTANDIPFVFIRSTLYVGNGKQRIKNMMLFAKNLCTTAKQYAKKHGKPDVILASSVHPLTVLAGEHIAKSFGVPCIAEFRDFWPTALVSTGALPKNSPLIFPLSVLEKMVYRRADAIISTVEGGKNYMVDRGFDKAHGGPVDLDKVYYICNGIDLAAYDYAKTHNTVEDAELNDPDTFKVIYTGSTRFANNLGFLIRVARQLQEDGNDRIKFLIYGDGEDLPELKAQSSDLSNIVFMGRRAKKNIPYILSKGDLCALNYPQMDMWKYGGSQNKLFEYLASGTPIISSVQIGYCLITKYKCGVIESTDSPRVYADTLKRISTMPKEEYDRMCHSGHECVAEFDFSKLTEKLIQICEGLIE